MENPYRYSLNGILTFFLFLLFISNTNAQTKKFSSWFRWSFGHSSCTMPPIINCPTEFKACPGVSTHPSNTGYATARPGDPGCGQPLVTYVDQILSQGPCSGAITLQRIWTASDPQDPTLNSSCLQRIQLSDLISPVITQCPANITVQAGSNCKANVFWIPPSVSDNCGRLFLTSSHVSGDLFSIGTTTVRYTAEDLCGNTSECSFTILVTGSCCTQAPILTCPLDYFGCPSDTLNPKKTGIAIAKGATADCGIPVLRYSDQIISSGPCPNAIQVNRTWLAMDPMDTNLRVSCLQKIELRDIEKPIFISCPSSIQLIPGVDCKATAQWNPAVATDNCGIVSITSNYASGSSFGPGITQVNFIATDGCGNTQSCSFEITVAPCCNVAPVINCPINYNGCPHGSVDPSITGVATAVPGGSGCNTPIISYKDILLKEGPCLGTKLISRIWTATDPSNTNLTSTCTQYVELKDNTIPSFTSCPPNIVLQAGPNCEAIAQWIVPTGVDNCSGVRIIGTHNPGSSFKLGITHVTYTILDDCGNVGTHTFTITVEGNCCNKPPVIHCPINYTGCPTLDYTPIITGMATATTEPGCGSPVITYSDIILKIYSQCPNSKLIKRTWRATDPNNSALFSECQQLIDLYDGVPPSFTSCPPNQTVYGNGNCEAIVYWTPPTAIDNCNGPVQIYSNYQPGQKFPNGITRVVYTVVDACGNKGTHQFEITVVGAGVDIECPRDIFVNRDPNYNGAYVSWKQPKIKLCGTCTDTLPGFLYMGEYNGHRYFCSRRSEFWAEAKRISESLGGYLAVIDSYDENAFVASKLMGATAWIGLTDERIEGYFEWVDGSPFSFSSWYPGQPNNQNNDQDHVEILPDGKWNDQFGNTRHEYICEFPCYTLKQISGPPNGSIFPCGTTRVSYVATEGNTKDTCQFYVTVNCPKAPPYCTAKALDCRYLWIDCVTLSNVNNCSGPNGGYGYFDNPCVQLHAHDTYRLCLKPGYSGNTYQVYWKVWIDYNADGDFDDNGELVAFGTGSTQICGNITIPSCISGNTRMRVVMSYGGYVSGPCCIFNSGEVEDYCVTLHGNTIAGGGSSEWSMHKIPIQLNQYTHEESTLVLPSMDEFDSYKSFRWKVFPNPVTDKLIIHSDPGEISSFRIFDIMGRLVYSQEMSETDKVIEIGTITWTSGAYIICVNTRDKRYEILKFIKKD